MGAEYSVVVLIKGNTADADQLCSAFCTASLLLWSARRTLRPIQGSCHPKYKLTVPARLVVSEPHPEGAENASLQVKASVAVP